MKSIRYTDGYKYQLERDYEDKIPIYPDAHVETPWCVLSVSGDLIIRKGYAWDGPSGPTLDTRNFMRGSLVHDTLYQLMREGLLDNGECKERADRLLEAMCIQDGMSAIRAWWVYKGVAGWGKASTMPSATKPIQIAP